MANQINFFDTRVCIGDTIAVHHKVKEGDKERIQVFTGVVIAIKGSQESRSFTVRKIGADSIGVERIWPINCPSLVKIDVRKKMSGVRRAKLYYLRLRTGKLALKVKGQEINQQPDDNAKKKSKTDSGTTRGKNSQKLSSR